MSFTIDLHHHVIPDFYWEASNEGGEAAGGITPPRWSLAGAIAYLDEGGIDAAVASISTPGVHFGDDMAGRTLARGVNEYLADLARRRRDRFGALASLPLPDVEGSLTELESRVSKLEKRVDALDKPKRTTSSSNPTAKKTSTAKSSTSKSGSA